MATNSKFNADLGLKTDADLQVDGNVTVSGNLTVNGTQTTVNSTTTSVEDSMLELANANLSSDTLDIGIYGNYDDGLGDDASEYTGFFRDASDSTWKLFDGLEVEPTTTVNTSGTGYTLADLQVGDLTATTLTATNALTGSSITYPTSDGTNGQVLKTNGSGVLSFGDIPAGYTDSDARSAISVSGNLAYNSSTGVISYSEPTMYADSDARSAISAGTGISYNSSTGVITNTVSNTDTTYSAGTGLSLSGTTFSSTITQYADSDVESYLSSNGYATQSTVVAAITDSAPATLDTLNELAAALGDDANFSTTVTNSIALKAPLASPVFSGTVDMGTFGNRTRAFEAYGSNVLFDGGSDKIDLIIGDGSSAYMSIQTTDTASAMNIRDYSGNADLVTIERTSGNVGIGTSVPAVPLHVNSTSGVSNRLAIFESDINNLNEYSSISVGHNVLSANFGLMLKTSDTAYIGVGSSGNVFDPTTGTGLYVNADGKVGIGTDSPSEMLHVLGGGSGPEIKLENSSGSHYIRAYNDNWNFLANSSNTAMTIKNSGQVNFGAGIGIGGTGAANTLDDYEEGTFTVTATPSVSGTVTLSSLNVGYYTKIGNRVFFNYRVDVASVSSPSGRLNMNLPFTVANTSPTASTRSTATTFIYNSVSTNIGDFVSFIPTGSSFVSIYVGSSATGSNTSANQMQTGTEIHLAGHYITN